ncbi:MAG: type IV toxin-antitoxin system AbiEi family antitoxin domain-containing protein [Hyphomicrobiales bacterium]|nr:type IV toxin-antitoxin system AbiEi family antitoxin domain-containing protein [Hyphomicrobiales bacterium]MCY4053311.1 type IV toxin-antitoxin system AbiEi family antitoxin domain-containing protein [Hyphomicrobiales bacterium]
MKKPICCHMHTRHTKSQRKTAIDLLGERGIMRSSELRASKIHCQTLARMVKDGKILRAGRGLYELPEADYSLNHSFAEIAKAVPKGVICLISALQFHELTLQLPPHAWVAIGRKEWMPRIRYPSFRAIRFGEKAMSVGIEHHVIDKVETPIFDPAKTIVDCFRYRKKIGIDVALEGLRNGIRERKAHPDKIVTYAQDLRIWSVLKPYLDATLAEISSEHT